MTTKDVLLLASLGLNVLLAIVLLFRSTISQIVVERYARRREEKDRRRKILGELNQKMDILINQYQGFLVWTFVASTAITPQEAEPAHRLQRETAEDLVRGKEFLAQHELEFPPSLQGLVRDLRREIEVEDIAKLRSGKALIQRSEAVLKVTTAIRAEIARLL